jgi:hypothetical protein
LKFVIVFKFFVSVVEFLHEGLCHKKPLFKLASIQILEIRSKWIRWIEIWLGSTKVWSRCSRHHLLIWGWIAGVSEKVVCDCLNFSRYCCRR